MRLDDGTAELEWLSPTSFRFARSWGGPIANPSKIAHSKVEPQLETTDASFTMRSKYMTAAVDRADLKTQVSTGSTAITWTALAKTADGIELRVTLAPDEKVFGLLGGSNARL